jgi:demethylmenaquinone methyltransferase/2-methoxy-6-polyprenyl-1,4-benzoquinol methylase
MEPLTNHARPAQRPLQKMFTEVPGRYDIINRILTLRLDERWRKKAADECVADQGGTIMDLCTGTGDLAIHISRKLNGKGKVFGVDFSQPMLNIARQKSLKYKLENISFLEADAASLPFEDESTDVVGIAFGFRNLIYKNPDRNRFLSEIFRVLCHGGRFVIVETSQPESKLLRWFFHRYLEIFVYYLGGWLTGNKPAYRYLALSARNFYTSGQLIQLLSETGFIINSHTSLMGGIAAITVAEKIS